MALVILPVARWYTPSDLMLHSATVSPVNRSCRKKQSSSLFPKVKDWRVSNLLLQKLQVLLSVFASKRLGALRLHRFLTKTRQCFKQAGNQQRTFAWFEALLKPQDLVLVLSSLLGCTVPSWDAVHVVHVCDGVFESALLVVRIKMRSPSCRNTVPIPMLGPCSFSLTSNKLCPSRAFHDSRATLSKMYRFTKGYQDGRLIHPQRRSQQRQPVPSIRVYTDKMIEHNEMILSSFHQTRNPDQRCYRGSTQRKDGSKPACYTSCQQTRKLELKGPMPATEDRNSFNAETKCATTTLHTLQWFTSLTHNWEGSVRHTKFR